MNSLATNNLDKAFQPALLGKLSLRNRIIKAATYEGKTPGGIPGQALLDFHRPICEGGVAMTTIGYCTTEADGRINEEMMYIHDGIHEPLSELVRTLKSTGAAVSGQMTHCGNFSKNRKLQRLKRPLGPSFQLNMLGLPVGLPLAGAMMMRDIDTLVQTYYDAASQMKAMGFDAVEIHFSHGYGLSQFISPKTNRRRDEYGGSLLNRMRLPLRVLDAVRSAVGDDFPILGKIGLTDGVKGGLEESEAIEVAALLDKAGIDALITSGGTSSFNVMEMFRGPSIVHGMIENERNLLMRLGLKLLGPSLFRNYPYQELYFLEGAKRVRDRVHNAQIVYIGGCSTPDSIAQAMAAGMDFIQMGRTLIKDPAFVKNAHAALRSGADYDSGCIHCNRCVTLIDAPGGVRCPLNDPA